MRNEIFVFQKNTSGQVSLSSYKFKCQTFLKSQLWKGYQQMADSVTVAIRMRPLNQQEKRMGGKECITVFEPSTVQLSQHPKKYNFDYVAQPHIQQAQIFEQVGKPIASYCLEGYNASIFAYGQTGTGKTYTIQGHGTLQMDANNSDRGLLPRCFEYIFANASNFSLRCSYLEIYKEQIVDLLVQKSPYLHMRENSHKGVYVDGLLQIEISSLAEIYELINLGHKNRHIAATAMNAQSSRSHSVFSVLLKTETKGVDRTSKFHLIDLAGSERQKLTAATGDRLKQASRINQSLSALGNVINSLSLLGEGKNRHIHYRDSKLTFLLKDSLGGNSKTCVIATVSAAYASLGETSSTLQFAARAKTVKCRAIINENQDQAQLLRLRQELEMLQKALKQALASCPICHGNPIKEPDYLQSREKELFPSSINFDQDILLDSADFFSKRDDISEENQALRQENQAIFDQLEAFRQQNMGLISENDSLYQDNTALRQQLEQHKQEVKQTAQNHESCSEQIMELEKKIRSLESSKLTLINQQENKNRTIESVSTKNTELTNRIATLSNLYLSDISPSFYTNKSRDFSEVMQLDNSSELIKQLQDVQTSLAQSQASNKRLRNQNEGIKERLEETQQLNLQAKDTIEMFHAELEAKNQKLESAQHAKLMLKKEIRVWKNCVDDKNQAIKALKKTLNEAYENINHRNPTRSDFGERSASVLVEEIKIKNEQIALLHQKLDDDRQGMGQKLKGISEFVHNASREIFGRELYPVGEVVLGIRHLLETIVQQREALRQVAHHGRKRKHQQLIEVQQNLCVRKYNNDE